MPAPMTLPESLKRWLTRRSGWSLEKIHAEASRRSFFRMQRGKTAIVAMVYPEPSPAEVQRFCAMQRIYRRHGLRVPRIDQVLGDQVVLQEDLGDLLLQKAWRGADAGERRCLLAQCREMLATLAAIPPRLVETRLDPARRKWELDFFLAHFHPRFPGGGISADELRPALQALVDGTAPETVFAHRDFHSRNLLVRGWEIAMVDFQDSLLAPRYYDLVSLAFDSYLDLGAFRGTLFPNLVAMGDDTELRQLRLTALQRNIKALGTFAFQTFERKHPVYARYIPRTIRHIREHLQLLADPGLEALSKYFLSLS